MTLVDALAPEALAEIQAHFDAEGCGWLVERCILPPDEAEDEGWDLGDMVFSRIEPCGAKVALTDEFASWACEAGHHHSALGSPAWQSEDFFD
jgi:hypothetical protein